MVAGLRLQVGAEAVRGVAGGHAGLFGLAAAVGLWLGAGKAAHCLPFGVENFQRHFSRRFFGQVVIDQGARRRVIGHVAVAAIAIAVGGRRRKEPRRRRVEAGRQLIEQGGAPVEHPKAAAHGGDDDVLAENLDIGNGGYRQVELEGLPVGAVVETDKQPVLGARVEDALPFGILAYHAHGVVGWKAAGDQGPAVAVVFGLVEIGLPVAELVAQRGDVGLAVAMGRGLDAVDAAAGRQVGGRDVAPVLAAVARDMDGPVVGAHPEEAGAARRLADGIDGAVELFAGNVARDGATGDDLLVGLEGRQVGRDGLPGDAVVRRLMQILRGVVDHVGVVRRDVDGRDALEAQDQIFRIVSVHELSFDVVAAFLAGALIIDAETPLAVAVDDVGIAGLGHGRPRFAAADLHPVAGRTAGRGIGRQGG